MSRAKSKQTPEVCGDCGALGESFKLKLLLL